jgi:hypothetical protein
MGALMAPEIIPPLSSGDGLPLEAFDGSKSELELSHEQGQASTGLLPHLQALSAFS